MITVLIFLVLGAVCGYKFWDDFSLRRFTDYVELCFSIVAFALIGTIIGAFVSMALPTKTKSVEKTYIIESMNDGTGIDGRFFIGSGVVKDKVKFTFYYHDLGAFKLGFIDADKAHVMYTKGEPFIKKVYKKEVDGYFWNNFSLLFDDDAYYYICVPEGSIKQNFVLDAM